jgi:hypothetical protein
MFSTPSNLLNLLHYNHVFRKEKDYDESRESTGGAEPSGYGQNPGGLWGDAVDRYLGSSLQPAKGLFGDHRRCDKNL